MSADITSVLEKIYAGTATGLVLALIPLIAVEQILNCISKWVRNVKKIMYFHY